MYVQACQMTCLSLLSTGLHYHLSGGIVCPSFTGFISTLVANVVNIFLGVCSHYDMTTITPPVTVLCSRAMLIIMTITLASTSVDQIKLGRQDVIMLPQLILRDTMKDSVASPICHSYNNLGHRCLLRHMPTMQWVLYR